MNYLILFFIIFMLVLGWINQKNKYLAYTIMLIFFILVCFSYDTYDYVNYNRMYEIIERGNTAGYEPLFELLMKGASFLSLNYDQFRMVCTAIEIALINSTIKRYCGNNAFVWSMFVVFPGWLLTTLFRFTIGFAIIIFGMRYLIEAKEGEYISERGKKHNKHVIKNSFWDTNVVKYIACVVIAALIHNSFWIMLIFILIKKFKTRSLLIISSVVVVIIWATGGTEIAKSITEILSLRDSYTERLLSGEYRNFNGMIYSLLRQLLVFGFAWLAVKYYKFGRNDYVKCIIEDRYMNLIIPINSVGFMLLGVAYFTSNTRLCHVIILLNLVAYGICINSKYRKTRTTALLKIVALGFALGLSYLMCTRESSDVFNLVLKMIFDTNKFINLFGY